MNRSLIAARFQSVRVASRLSQGEFAERLGVCRIAVGHWESGRGLPTARRLIALCEQFDIDCNWLLALDE